MSYFSLAHRVPETSAVEPKVLAWVYGLITERRGAIAPPEEQGAAAPPEEEDDA